MIFVFVYIKEKNKLLILTIFYSPLLNHNIYIYVNDEKRAKKVYAYK